MPKVLSIDLGITTGYAVFRYDSDEPIEYGEIAEKDLPYRLQEIMLSHLITHSVCEDPVIFRGQLGDRLAKLLAIVNIVCTRQVKHIGPASWKPHPIAKTPLPRGLSPHIRDAWHIGLWYKNELQR